MSLGHYGRNIPAITVCAAELAHIGGMRAFDNVLFSNFLSCMHDDLTVMVKWLGYHGAPPVGQ